MTKQLLIYETAVPVSPARHGKHSIEVGGDYAFSAGVNAVPLMAVEILRAATEYAVVFTAVGDDVMPAVVLGVKGDRTCILAPTATGMPSTSRRSSAAIRSSSPPAPTTKRSRCASTRPKIGRASCRERVYSSV